MLVIAYLGLAVLGVLLLGDDGRGLLSLPAVLLVVPLSMAVLFLLVRKVVTPVSASVFAALLLMISMASWLRSLALHEVAVSGVLVLVAAGALWLCCRGWRARIRYAASAVLAAMMVLVSHGVIWGETRCGEGGRVDCLVADGPRVWVPGWLERMGVAAFVVAPGMDLEGFDLSDRNLRYADFSGAGLKGVKLDRSYLRRARLAGANLREASLHVTWVQGADFRDADLRGADLRGIRAYAADFRGADLRGVNAVGASLSHVLVDGARFDGADLRAAYLRFSEGLTQAQLDTACGDAATQLPPGLAIPDCGAAAGQLLLQKP